MSKKNKIKCELCIGSGVLLFCSCGELIEGETLKQTHGYSAYKCRHCKAQTTNIHENADRCDECRGSGFIEV